MLKKILINFIKWIILIWIIPTSIYGNDQIVLIPTNFNTLPDWRGANLLPSLQVFQLSCQAMLAKPNNFNTIAILPLEIKANIWQQICKNAVEIQPVNSSIARAFFEKNFQPWLISFNHQTTGLFTGYYQPFLQASSIQRPSYEVPLYGLPKYKPYPSRNEIDKGALKGQDVEILWLKSKIDRFFLQIQGSGLAIVDANHYVQIAYAGKNDYPYVSIGKLLVEQGIFTPQQISLPVLRSWLINHPKQAERLMSKNASFVFFDILPVKTLDKFDEVRPQQKISIYTTDASSLISSAVEFTHQPSQGPIGAAGVPLTPGYSLAIDRHYFPLGLPLWLVTEVPTSNNSKTLFKRLMITQDTGSAIQGIIRGDVFWGYGQQAEYIAGHMRSQGSYWLLAPCIACFP